MSITSERWTKPGKRTAFALCAALALCIGAVGCGDDDSDSNGGSDDKPANVALITFGLNDFTQVQADGIKEAVTPGGGSVKAFDYKFDPATSVKQCQDAITSGRYNVIIYTPLDAASGTPCAKAAAAANIPLITLDLAMGEEPNNIAPTVDGVIAAATLTPESNAGQQVELAKRACEGVDPCEIVAEVGFAGDSYAQAGLDAIEAQVPNAKIIQKVASNYDPAVVAKAIPDVLTAHPEIDVFLAQSDSSALAVVPALKDAGLTDKVKLIGGGGSRAGAKAVAAGTLFGSIATWPLQEGQTVGEWAVLAANGETIDPNAVDVLKLDEPSIIDKDSIAEFESEWGAE